MRKWALQEDFFIVKNTWVDQIETRVSSWGCVANTSKKSGLVHTLFWLRTSFTTYGPSFFSHFQATFCIRNALKLVLKSKMAFQYHWGLSPSILFLMFPDLGPWTNMQRGLRPVFIRHQTTSDSQPYGWLLDCWFSYCCLQCYKETRLSGLSSKHHFS